MGLSVECRIHLRRGDMDRLEHLNYASYHDLFYEARVALLASIRTEVSGFVLARSELDYLHEVRLADGHVDVFARIEDVGTKSMAIEHEMRLPDGTLAARSRTIVVAWDSATRRSRPLTAQERGALSGA